MLDGASPAASLLVPRGSFSKVGSFIALLVSCVTLYLFHLPKWELPPYHPKHSNCHVFLCSMRDYLLPICLLLHNTVSM